MATKNGHTEAVRTLCKLGADVGLMDMVAIFLPIQIVDATLKNKTLVRKFSADGGF